MLRSTYDGSSPDVPFVDVGQTEGFGNQYARLLRALFDNSALPLSNVAGTNSLTADVDPEIDTHGLTDNMVFRFMATSVNSGGVTLTIAGTPEADILNADGTTLEAGTLQPGTLYDVVYWAGNYILRGAVSAQASIEFQQWTFDNSGTWVKPAGVGNDRAIIVQMWGGGGGGGTNNRGGGGGSYIEGSFLSQDVSNTEAIGIGAGGAVNASGGNTTFGIRLTAFGGGSGLVSTGENGGGPGPNGTYGSNETIWSGGRGGLSASNAVGTGVLGGGGGGGANIGVFAAGGESVFGGAGGNNNEPGEAPGGGGGGNAVGAKGKVVVTLI